ncbi:MAG: SPFH domain-containing protein [Gemmatimonadales bacterium]|nr:SPFH domain-containing protein [Gemmatimonadales bacterium]
MATFQEREVRLPSGLLMLVLLLAALGGAAWAFVSGVTRANIPLVVVAVIGALVTLVLLGGIFVVNPNEARVLTLFGRYTGSSKTAGIWYTNPFAVKHKLSLRVRNFETAKLKVNDSHSNPIEIGAVVVWQVVETAHALFEVDDYENFVRVQSEAALRQLASSYPYDSHSDEASLSGSPAEVAKLLETHVQERLEKAGVHVLETRISHLAYAPEIAQAMLQRQQAAAIVAARYKIVEGAVGMVESALEMLSARGVINLDDERKAAMVSNLLVVLCGERATQPVVNTGTLYS